MAEGFMTLPGTSGHYITTADSAALSIPGDISYVAKIAADDYTPSDSDFIISHDASGDRSWSFGIESFGGDVGKLRYSWSLDGSSTFKQISSSATGATDGTDLWVRADVLTSSGGNTSIDWYTGGSGIVPSWSALGSNPVTDANDGDRADSTAAVRIGGSADNTQLFAGKLYYIQVKEGSFAAGTERVSLDFRTTTQVSSTPPDYSEWTDDQSTVWTVAGGSSVYTPPTTAWAVGFREQDSLIRR